MPIGQKSAPNMQISDKDSGPRTSSSLEWKPTFAIESGGQKGDQTEE